MGVVYGISFVSWLIQVDELYGDDGLLPIKYINKIYVPKIFVEIVSLDIQLKIIGIIGTIIGIMITKGILKWYLFAIEFYLYLNIYRMGQDFAQFQWDILLLESGFIAILFCNFNVLGRELYRWLAFRLYMSSGLLKLLSECPTWWDLSALHHHFASQCLPHILSWYAHQLPMEFKRFLVAGNFYILIVGSLLFYFPFRQFRIYGALLNILMQITIMMTGNFNYFNILSITITLSILDDQFIFNLKTNQNKKIKYFGIFMCLYSTGVIMFNLFHDSIFRNAKLPFTVKDIAQTFLSDQVISYFTMYVIFFFFFYLSYFNLQTNHKGKSINRIINTIIQIILFLFCFSMANMKFQWGLGIRDFYSPIIPQTYLATLSQYTNEYHIFSSYGLFRKMTGVNGRPELIFEASIDGKNYLEYEFHYKPGNLSQITPFILPHQPRLDWQLWFAALGEQPQDLYLVHLIYKMLTHKDLRMFVKTNPFENRVPKYIRIQKYLYYFTSIEEMIQSGQYWKRIHKSEYLPPITIQSLQKYAQEYHFN